MNELPPLPQGRGDLNAHGSEQPTRISTFLCFWRGGVWFNDIPRSGSRLLHGDIHGIEFDENRIAAKFRRYVADRAASSKGVQHRAPFGAPGEDARLN